MKTFIYICLLVIGLVLPAGAQVPIQSYRGQVSVKQNRIEREGSVVSMPERLLSPPMLAMTTPSF